MSALLSSPLESVSVDESAALKMPKNSRAREVCSLPLALNAIEFGWEERIRETAFSNHCLAVVKALRLAHAEREASDKKNKTEK